MQARWIRIALAVAMLAATSTRAADIPSICRDCQLQLGVGGTYHYWGSTGGLVVPLTLDLDGNRWELGLFRIVHAQSFYDSSIHATRHLAEPYWGASASRRWQLVGTPRWKLFVGLGGSYKTERDQLSASPWNFAEQLGMRIALNNHGSFVELTMRHWSNAGIKLPNRGQDFATVTFVFSPGQFAGTYANARARAEEEPARP
jgi:hypothetical protein